ncbi:MAG: hypothetical protein LUE65_11035 [Clostridiales bacterium]|nr:hypothetical protein [Clostridiales bacterium]
MKKMRKLRTIGKTVALVLMMAVLGSFPVFAGQWEQQEDGAWKYEEDGSYLTGWVSVEGTWYYMDPETEEWVRNPSINRNNVCYLLENAVTKAGWYATETSDMVYLVESVSSNKITVSIRLQTQPYLTASTLARFEVSLRDRTAKEMSTKLVLNLYD